MNNDWHPRGQLGKPAGWLHLYYIAVGHDRDRRQESYAINTKSTLGFRWQTAADNGCSQLLEKLGQAHT